MTDEWSELANVTLTPADHTASTTFPGYVWETDEVTYLEDFQQKYGEIHGYIAVFVCTFGAIANILNIIVLTRKHMISPANFILTALAISDFLIMLTYFIYAAYFFVIKKPRFDYTHSIEWIYFIMIHNYFIVTCHNLSAWFTVTLAVFRYIFVCRGIVACRQTSNRRAKLAVIIVAVGTVLLCIPNYFMNKVIHVSQYYEEMRGYWVIHSDFVEEHPVYKVVMMWLFGVIMKIVPCFILTSLSILIIIKMKRGIRQRNRFLNQVQSEEHNVNHEHNRTTYMLLCVVILFVITEFPQGVLAMIAGLNDNFFEEVYANLGDLMDLLVLINSAVNFILYCGMSQQFRDTFRSLYMRGCNRRLQNTHCHESSSTKLSYI